MTTPIRVAVTGAAGRISYALLFRLAAGAMFGTEQPVALSLLNVPEAMPRMFLLALASLEARMEGTVGPGQDLNTDDNLSRDGAGDRGIGTDGRGPWNADGEWNFVDRPEERHSAEVSRPK